MKFAIVNGRFVTNDASQPFLDGVMIVEDSYITHLSPHVDPIKLKDCDIIDGRHHVYIPGLINTHGHSPMSLLRGYADDLALHDWLQKVWQMEAKFDQDSIKLASTLSIIEMIKNGTTCYADMFLHIDSIAECVLGSGIRACLTQSISNFRTEAETEANFRKSYQFAKTWHKKVNDRITAMMSIHATFTCSPDLITKLVEAAHELNLPINTHVSESLTDIKLCQEMYHLRPIAYLEKYGIFTRPCLFAHVVHVTDEEIEKLANHAVNISHNPSSNLKLASGIAPIPRFLQRGINISLGTDGPASNNKLDLFEEMRLAALLHKGYNHDPEVVNATQAFEMATCNGAKAMWLNDAIGTLKAGMKADFIAINTDQPHFYPHHHNFTSHLVYSASGEDVTDVWVDGQQLMKDKHLLTLDEGKIKTDFQQCYKELRNSI